MKDHHFTLPFYARASVFFVGLYVVVSILYITQSIVVPLIFALIISIVLHPVVNFFVKIKINRIVAIIITLTLTLAVIGSFGMLLVSQASLFSESWPKFVVKFTEIFNESVTWASGYFDISPQKIEAWVSKTKGEMFNTSGSSIKQTITSVSSGMVTLFVIPVYIFMFLYYKPLLLEFFHKLFSEENHTAVGQVINQIKTVIQRYLIGLVLEVIIVATLNSVGLLILGIDYAILLGIIGALLNLIPYIGGLVAVALPMMIAIVTTSSPINALYVLGIYYFIQLIDNNYIVPMIVASKVKINALVSIIAIFAFGVLWGIPGMFLSIPLVAILKVVFDHFESLKPWGFLLGDTMPAIELFKLKLKTKRKS
ncbi:MAG: AI-2E family transporter [Bacteroidetes bacterium HGW-Bacteroidetes-16]|jgi:predicted PurR-regulated permease PerM|nr:MAG: AI-2E family transporter [Bacteroidetes bacterium HGW-Bacteroidetes-16]